MSKKLESTLLNMVLSLTIIGVTMSAALGFVYTKTKYPIEKSNKQNIINAIQAVLPEFDNDPLSEKEIVNDLEFYCARKNGKIVGYAVKTFSMKGFNGLISLMVGLKPDGTIYKIRVLEQKETPGLGSRMTEPSFIEQFLDKNPGNYKLKVKKDGGDVDAITASTITSRAFCDALQRSYDALKSKQNNNDNVTSDEIKNINNSDSVSKIPVNKVKGGEK